MTCKWMSMKSPGPREATEPMALREVPIAAVVRERVVAVEVREA